MGTLVVKRYPTNLFLKLADHTYVECGTGKKAWKCWGGKEGGMVLREAPASTKRADMIAQPDEKAGIACYLINGVCHQAANRILLPARITVRGARGYSVSEALFGPYGRIGFWPCKSPFEKYDTITGDLSPCISEKMVASIEKQTAEEKSELKYIQKTLEIYSKSEKQIMTKSLSPEDVRNVHLELFMNMVDYKLGTELESKQLSDLREVRNNTEGLIEEAQQLGTIMTKNNTMNINKEYVVTFNKITESFQDDVANLLSADSYEKLLGVDRDERIILSDPTILKSEYSINLEY